jgi:hypothetical protein
VIPPQANAEFVCAMEDVLALYHQPYDPVRPIVCFDEGTKQLIGETRSPLPMTPGERLRYDYEYERHGTCNLFLFFAPLNAWRHVEVTERRTMIDYAYCMRDLVDVYFPDAEVVRVVQDNHFTPKHGSWLNMAEIELNVLNSQCLDRRIAAQETLTTEVAAWERQRNQRASTVNWRFTTADARIKLRKLYPSFHA